MSEENSTEGQQPERSSAIKFPCAFPVKVMGKADDSFLADATAIFKKHYPKLADDDFSQRASKAKNFIALTATVPAQSQAELDALYYELTECPTIIMSF